MFSNSWCSGATTDQQEQPHASVHQVLALYFLVEKHKVISQLLIPNTVSNTTKRTWQHATYNAQPLHPTMPHLIARVTRRRQVKKSQPRTNLHIGRVPTGKF